MEERTVPNLIVDDGVAAVAGLILQSGSTSPFRYIAIGTSTAAAASSDTALYNELTTGGGERAAATPSRTTSDVTNDTAQLVKNFVFETTGAGWAITEAAVFASSSSGPMLCRQTFTAIDVVSADALSITYRLDVD